LQTNIVRKELRKVFVKIENTDHITKNDVRKKTSNYVRKKLQTLYAKIEGTNENSTFKEGEAAFYILKMW